MPIPSTIKNKNAPAHIVARLRKQTVRGSLTPKDVVAEVKRLGIRSRSNSAKIVRALRDAR
jgi:hypothetical protein